MKRAAPQHDPVPKYPYGVKNSTFRLSDAARALLRALSEQRHLSQTANLELAIVHEAETNGLRWDGTQVVSIDKASR